jgi:hypothetical protein
MEEPSSTKNMMKRSLTTTIGKNSPNIVVKNSYGTLTRFTQSIGKFYNTREKNWTSTGGPPFQICV